MEGNAINLSQSNYQLKSMLKHRRYVIRAVTTITVTSGDNTDIRDTSNIC